MIEVRKLLKQFDNGITAIDNIDLTIESGSVYGLVGTNGSGKSTLLRILSGVYQSDSGQALIDGQNPFESIETRGRIFYVSDDPYYIHQSNLLEMAAFYKMTYARFSDEHFNYLSTVFPINVKQRIDSMSKGMKRQAALMLVLSACPDYLFLDEAFDGLDPVLRTVIKRLIAEGISERSMTVIISSHNLRELEDLCDHVCLLHKGTVIAQNELDELRGSLHKAQVAFKQMPDEHFFDGLQILKMTNQGSVYNLVIRGDAELTVKTLENENVVFSEILMPTLEEVFIYEMGGIGYDVSSILG